MYVCICWRSCFITAKISSFETVAKREAILDPVPKHWLSKDIPSYRSQSERTKITFHRFGEYEYVLLTKRKVKLAGYWPSSLHTYHENNVRMLTSVRYFACAGENKGTESKTEGESLSVGRDMWLSPKLFLEVVIKRKSNSWDARTF